MPLCRFALLIAAILVSPPVHAESSKDPHVLVLGTAQDGGLPQIGSRSPQSERARRDPDARRLVASLLIVDPRSGTRWLIDATPDIREQVERAEGHPPTRKTRGARPPLFEGIFLSHAHMGHYTGLIHLGREAYGAHKMPVHASARMCEFLRKNAPWDLLVRAEHIQLHPFQPGEPVQLTPDLTVTPFQVPHRDEYTDTMGFLIKGPRRSLLYIPDIDKWDRWKRPVEDLIATVDIALLDGTFYADGEIPGRAMAEIPHPFILESLKRFATLPVSERRKIRFIHLNHTNPAADPTGSEARKIRETGMDITEEGQQFSL
jgi:pyrroloquinoline quinone biosynthesis protein B